jgi:hypothetical protein
MRRRVRRNSSKRSTHRWQPCHWPESWLRQRLSQRIKARADTQVSRYFSIPETIGAQLNTSELARGELRHCQSHPAHFFSLEIQPLRIRSAIRCFLNPECTRFFLERGGSLRPMYVHRYVIGDVINPRPYVVYLIERTPPAPHPDGQHTQNTTSRECFFAAVTSNKHTEDQLRSEYLTPEEVTYRIHPFLSCEDKQDGN